LELISKDLLVQIITYINNIDLKNFNDLIKLKISDWKLLFQFRFPLINFKNTLIDIDFNNLDSNYYIIKYIILIGTYNDYIKTIKEINNNNDYVNKKSSDYILDEVEIDDLSYYLSYIISYKNIDFILKLDFNIDSIHTIIIT